MENKQRYRIQLRYFNGAKAEANILKPPTKTFWSDTSSGKACFELLLVLINGGENGRIIKYVYKQVTNKEDILV